MNPFRHLIGCALVAAGCIADPAAASELERCLEQGLQGIEQAESAGYMSPEDAETSREMIRQSCAMLAEMSEQQPAARQNQRRSPHRAGRAVAAPGQATAPGRWIDRPDPMHELQLHDADMHEGRIRLLFKAWPSLQQARDPDRSFNLYVAEVPVDGSPELHHLYSGQDERYSALHPMWLRRAHDSILIQVSRPDRQWPALEERNARTGAIIDTVPVPRLAGPENGGGDIGRTATVFADGTLAYVRSGNVDRAGNPARIGWFRYSPDGSVLAQGWQPLPGARIQATGIIENAAGRQPVIMLDRRADNDHGLDDLESWSESVELGGRRMTARMYSATQLFMIDASGERGRLVGPPLAASVTWEGDLAVPQDLPYEQKIAQSNEQMRLQAEVGARLGTDWRLLEVEFGGWRQVRLRTTGNGVALLRERSRNRRLEQQEHGWHFVELGQTDILRDLPIQSAFEEPDLQPIDFAARDDGGFVVLALYRGRDEGHGDQLIAFDADGREVERFALIQGPDAASRDTWVQLRMLAGDEGHYRAVGTGMSPKRQQAVWVSGPVGI